MASSLNDQQATKLENGEDIISNLTDEVRLYILSFLSTKDAFRTSVLSSNWENLWTLVPILDFRPNNKNACWDHHVEDPGYMNFIERVFLSHNSNSNTINKFRIVTTSEIDTSLLNDWISTVVERGVQEIDIGPFGVPFKFPESLFTCKTLVTLKLRSFLGLDHVPASIHFPCLKVFHVAIFHPTNELTQKLFCSSPVLEELRIDVFNDSGELIYNVSSPCLKKFHLCISPDNVKNFNSVVDIDAPLLESLEVVNAGCARYIFKNSSKNLVKVLVDLYYFHGDAMENYSLVENIVMLLKSVSFVKNLSLGGCLPMEVFGSAFDIKWPVFANVTRLELEILEDFASSRFSKWPAFPGLNNLQLNVDKDLASKNLSDLLNLAPNLVSLVFVKGNLRKYPKQFDCAEQRGVPNCLGSCLKEIEMHNFDGLESELNLIKYLLLNAQVLEKMTVTVSPAFCILNQLNVEEWKSEIDMMPRCARHLELNFS